MSQFNFEEFENYGDQHRLFVQSMLSKKIIESKEFKSLFELCLKKCDIDPPPVQVASECQKRFLFAINNQLRDTCGLKILKTMDEEQRMKVSKLVLTNQTDRSKDASKLTIKAMVTYAAHELEYLKLMVDAIMENPMRELRKIDANNIGREVKGKKISVQESESILKKFEDHNWLINARDSPTIRLSTRFIFEMEQFLREHYPSQVNNCGYCNKFVIRSVDCRNADCKTSHHLYCANDRERKNKCSKCKLQLPMAREILDEDDEDNDRRGSQKHHRSGEKRRRIQRMASDSEDSD